MAIYQYSLNQFESLAGLSNDEIQLFYELYRSHGTPVPLATLMQVCMTNDKQVIRTFLRSIDTKLKPLGYEVRSILDAGYILYDATVKSDVVQEDNQSHE